MGCRRILSRKTSDFTFVHRVRSRKVEVDHLSTFLRMLVDLSESVDLYWVDPNHVDLYTSSYKHPLSLPAVRSLLAITSGPWDILLYSESEVGLFIVERSTSFPNRELRFSTFALGRHRTASTVLLLDRPMVCESQSPPLGHFPLADAFPFEADS